MRRVKQVWAYGFHVILPFCIAEHGRVGYARCQVEKTEEQQKISQNILAS